MAYVRDSSEDLVWDNDSGQYVPATVTCRLTVIPNPSGATVTLSAEGYQTVTGTGTQYIDVISGTEVTYYAECEGYADETQTTTLTSDVTVNADLLQLFVLRVTAQQTEATIALRATTTETGMGEASITVASGTDVQVDVTLSGYEPYSQSHNITSNTTLNIDLEPITYDVTITPNPSGATVTLSAEGYQSVTGTGTQTIEVVDGTEVEYIVHLNNSYETISGSFIVENNDISETIVLRQLVSLTLTPNPSSAYVVLSADGYQPVSGSGEQMITVASGIDVTYNVTADHYVAQTGTITVVSDTSQTISLSLTQYDVTIVPTPSDAIVTLTADGFDPVDNTIRVDYGTTVSYLVEKQGYESRSGSIPSVTENITLPINLSSNLVTLEIIPTPADATVTLTAQGYTSSGNSIEVIVGTTVSYTVSKTGYETISSSQEVNNSQRLYVNLREIVRFTIEPSPASATVVLVDQDDSQYVQPTGTNYIEVPAGDTVSYTVSAQDYNTQTGTVNPTSTQTIPVILATTYCTLTIIPTPSTASVTFNASGTVSGNSITVLNGEDVTYTVSATGYVTQTNTISLTYTRTLNIDLNNLVTYTVIPVPSNAAVVLTSSDPNYTQSNASITVPNGTTITFNVSATGYIPKTGTRVITSTTSETIALTSSSTTMDPLNVIPNVNPDTVYGDHEIKTDVIELLKDKIDQFQGVSEVGRILAVDVDGYVKLSQGLPGFVANWGEINGTLSDQTDLQNALNLKANDNDVVKTSGNQSINGTKTFNSTTWLKLTDADHTIAPNAYKERVYGIEDMNNKRIGSLGTGIVQNTTTVRCYMGAAKEINGSYQYSHLETYIDDAGNKWTSAPVPTASNSTSETKIATVGWVNNPNYSTNVVHRTGNETIGGVKTFTSTIQGTCTNALWADLAEQYVSDEKYPVGTLICFGGEKDITIAKVNCNGVISDKPGFLLDSKLENSQPIALVGKTPIRVIGKIKKFDRIVLSDIPGVGKEQTTSEEKIIAIALEDNDNSEEKLVKCVTKFTLD